MTQSGAFLRQMANDRTRGHSLKVSKPRVRLLTRQRFFSSRAVSSWNRLPHSLIDSENASSAEWPTIEQNREDCYNIIL